jgi:hypothetical protein
MSLTSRRTLLATGAALAAVPVGAVAAQASVNPDAELLALGRQLAILHAEDIRTEEVSEATAEEASEETTRRLGYDLDQEKATKTNESWIVMYGIVRRESGADALSDANYAVWQRIEPIYRRVMAMPAHTVAGIGVKARAVAMFAVSYLWDKGEQAE